MKDYPNVQNIVLIREKSNKVELCCDAHIFFFVAKDVAFRAAFSECHLYCSQTAVIFINFFCKVRLKVSIIFRQNSITLEGLSDGQEGLILSTGEMGQA